VPALGFKMQGYMIDTLILLPLPKLNQRVSPSA
jgi:hypothetical protein